MWVRCAALRASMRTHTSVCGRANTMCMFSSTRKKNVQKRVFHFSCLFDRIWFWWLAFREMFSVSSFFVRFFDSSTFLCKFDSYFSFLFLYISFIFYLFIFFFFFVESQINIWLQLSMKNKDCVKYWKCANHNDFSTKVITYTLGQCSGSCISFWLVNEISTPTSINNEEIWKTTFKSKCSHLDALTLMRIDYVK